MATQRLFLDWSQPALPVAARRIVDDFLRAGTDQDARFLDLRGTTIVVPVSRAGRRLVELLVEEAERQEQILLPPSIVTTGSLAELLYDAPGSIANDLQELLSWEKALRALPTEVTEKVFPLPPQKTDASGWMKLAQQVRDIYVELAASVKSFADLVEATSVLPVVSERSRWEVLSQLEEHYHAALVDIGVFDKHLSRRSAIEQNQISFPDRLILLCTPDLNVVTQMMLPQIDGEITVFVHAPRSEAENFDEFGVIKHECWIGRNIALREEQVKVVARPDDQALAAVECLVERDGEFASQEVSLGVIDDELVSPLRQRFSREGIDLHHGGGTSLGHFSPILLLQLVTEYLATRSFRSFAALVRHPDLEGYLSAWHDEPGLGSGRGNLLSKLDSYYQEHLPAQVSEGFPFESSDNSVLQRYFDLLETTLSPLSSGSLSGYRECAEAVAEFLGSIYFYQPRKRELQSDRRLIEVCEKIRETLQQFRELRSELNSDCSAHEFLELLLWKLEREAVADEASSESLELLGWLELALDDAAFTVITGFNEGRIPESITGDPFLPGRLRELVGLPGEHERYARDLFLLTSMLASKKHLHLICGRQSQNGDGLLPSRLLSACSDQDLPRWVNFLYGEPKRFVRAYEQLTPAVVAPIETLRPESFLTVGSPLSVTAFRDYIRCPFRFYLRHVLRLREESDRELEMNPMLFGSVIHAALAAFGDSGIAESTEETKINKFLQEELDRIYECTFAAQAHSSVQIQFHQIKARLEAYSRWQASWRAAGWKIHSCEQDFQGGLLQSEKGDLGIKARIDRIDVHEESGAAMVLDFKSGERALTPERAHRDPEGSWKDLQLPLYWHLVCEQTSISEVQIGYVALPRDSAEVGLLQADWSSDDLSEAISQARVIAARILDREFWPPASLLPHQDDYSRLFHLEMFRDQQLGGQDE